MNCNCLASLRSSNHMYLAVGHWTIRWLMVLVLRADNAPDLWVFFCLVYHLSNIDFSAPTRRRSFLLTVPNFSRDWSGRWSR
jgi:hypothetical protein